MNHRIHWILVVVVITKKQLKQQVEYFDYLLIVTAITIVAIVIAVASQDRQTDSHWNAKDNYLKHFIVIVITAKISKHINIAMLTTKKSANIWINSKD